jgi:hypothetical protein
MNTSKSSYKRLMSLVLSVLMIVAMCSVSAAADNDNTCIKVNGELAVDGAEYNEDAAVTIAAEDMTGVIVTVNGKAVVLDDNNGFVIAVKEGFEATETTDSPDTADDAAAKTEKVVAEDGAYQIIVTQNGGSISEVTIVVKEKDADTDTTDPEDTTDPTDETPDPTDETPDPTDETPDPTDETPDPTDETPDPTDETPDPTDETPDPTDETPDPTDETPDPTDETPDPTDETPDPETPDPETPDPETPDPETPDPLKPFYGDINLDGKVTAKDALLAQRYAINLEKLNEQQILNGDVDGKSAGGKKVTAADGMYILRHSIKLINKFPIEG